MMSVYSCLTRSGCAMCCHLQRQCSRAMLTVRMNAASSLLHTLNALHVCSEHSIVGIGEIASLNILQSYSMIRHQAVNLNIVTISHVCSVVSRLEHV